MEFGIDERMSAEPHANLLHQPAEFTAPTPQVLAPVVARPCLVPVDEEDRPRAAQSEPSAKNAEVGRGSDVDDVVVTAMAQEVREDSLAITECLTDRARAVVAVELILRSDHNHLHARNLGRRIIVPLAASQVRDLVALAG